MICMSMGLQNPAYLELMRLHEGNDLISGFGAGSARFRVIVQHRVNNGARASIALIDHVGVGPGFRVKKAFNQRSALCSQRILSIE